MNKLMMTLLGTATALTGLASPALGADRIRELPFEIEQDTGYVVARIGPVHRFRTDYFGPKIHLVRVNDAGTAFYFDVPDGEDDDAVIGGRTSLAANSSISVHVTELTPGNWVIYGTDTTCFCLGSYMFTVRPGEVTDLGWIYADFENGRSDNEDLAEFTLSEDLLDWAGREGIIVNDVMIVRPAEEGDILPAEMREMPVRIADYVEDVRFDNIRGSLINRATGLGPMQSVPLGATGLIIGGEPAGQ